jgi:hypothetical protein
MDIIINQLSLFLNGMDWIDMAQDREKWRALLNTVLNLRVP